MGLLLGIGIAEPSPKFPILLELSKFEKGQSSSMALHGTNVIEITPTREGGREHFIQAAKKEGNKSLLSQLRQGHRSGKRCSSRVQSTVGHRRTRETEPKVTPCTKPPDLQGGVYGVPRWRFAREHY